MRLLDFGDTAVLVELTSLDEVLGLHAALTSSLADLGAPAVEDLVPAERTLLIRFDPKACSCDQVRHWVTTVPVVRPGRTERAAGGAEVEVEVRYDGPDLDDVGRITGLGVQGVIDAHSRTSWTVAFTGFAPGFGYLIAPEGHWHVPRLDIPRVRVPGGSVALAGRYCGVYPRESPGGWRVIGTTRTLVWDLDRDPPALLRPGVLVRFLPVEDS